GRPIMARRPPDDEPEWAGAVTRAIHPWSSRRAMPDDELSPEEEAELERLAHDVVDEAERVGVDWDAAQERMRALAEAEWTAAGEGTAGELTIGLDMSTLLDVLRQLPDGAG